MLSESEYLAPVALFEKGKIASQIIYSNVKEIVDQHQYIFDILWDKALSAEQRIRRNRALSNKISGKTRRGY
jgi:hypothetical protein